MNYLSEDYAGGREMCGVPGSGISGLSPESYEDRLSAVTCLLPWQAWAVNSNCKLVPPLPVPYLN